MSATEYLDELKEYMGDGSKLRMIVVYPDGAERWIRGKIVEVSTSSVLIEYSPYTQSKFDCKTELLNLLSVDIITVTKMTDAWKGWNEGEWPQWGGLRKLLHFLKEFFTDRF